MESPWNMYDTFKDEIWKELGQLDPDWFHVLSAQTSTSEGNGSDQDELCANQEGNFKAPCDRTALESQLFSTPKVFRRSRVVSPETEGEQSFTAEQEARPWKETQSPCLFHMTKERISESKCGRFDFLQTSPKSPVSYAKQISESLGAQIHPDISWTSSLNTPPAVPSTLILSKTDESPSPMSVSEDSNVVFVRKLFPSLSNASVATAVSPQNNHVLVHTGVVSPEAAQNPESHNSPQDSPHPSPSVWRQKLPDAIEDGDVRSTVASVLDGAENVLSMFFSNSSSALRKVKTDRIKRKQIISTKERVGSFTDVSITNSAASLEQRTDDREPVKISSPPPQKTRDTGITQWSPLSLSDIPPSSVDSSCRDNNHAATQVDNKTVPEQLRSSSDSSQLTRPHLTGSYYGFTKKKRQFVYTIETPKPQAQGNEPPSVKNDTSPRIPGNKGSAKLLGEIQDEADCCRIKEDETQKQKNDTEENVPLPVQPKAQELDMSQLCRDFAQDFSQMLGPGKPSKVAEVTPQNGFSPSTCLNAMKQAKQRGRQANVPLDCDHTTERKPVSATAQNFSINEGTGFDSGFPSAVADISHLTSTSFILPSSENNAQSQQKTVFKTETQRPASSLSTNIKHVKYHQGAETEAKLSSAVKEGQTLGPCRESEFHIESTSTELPSGATEGVDTINHFPAKFPSDGNFPERATVSLPSVHASVFKTASNKAIEVSPAHLERAKHLFEENKAERPFSAESTKRGSGAKEEIHTSIDPVKNTIAASKQPPSSSERFGEISCQLTASQKADVTALCTLMEEADSQFDFTQFKTAKLQQHCQDEATSPQKADKELDPDFFMGIDFDDSFSSDAEKHKMTSASNCEASTLTNRSTLTKETPSTEDASPSSKSISDRRRCIVSAEPQNPNRAGFTETSEQENKTPLMPSVGFKTARGSDLRISKEHLRKARALFADLGENLTDQKLGDKLSSDAAAKSEQRQITSITDTNAALTFNNRKMEASSYQSDFQLSSGKGVSISAKAMQEADSLFKDCDITDNKPAASVKHQKNTEQFPTVSHTKSLLKFKGMQGFKENFSEEAIGECSKASAGPAASHTKVVQHKSTLKAFSSPLCSTSKSSGSSGMNQSNNGGGFSTASGKKVCVSADAVRKAERLLNESHAPEDTKNQLQQEGDALRTAHVADQIQVGPIKNGGFQTASGKGVVVSAAALKKAKLLLIQCEAVEDEIDVKPSHSKTPVRGLASRTSGFLAASGKPVGLSAEALRKAKALFSDITLSAELPAVSDTKETQGNADNSDKTHCGFITAGGASGGLSKKKKFKAKNILKEFDNGSDSVESLQEAEAFFEDCDNMDRDNGTMVKYESSVAPVRGGDSEKEQDQGLTDTSEERGSGHSVNKNGFLHPGDVRTLEDLTNGNPSKHLSTRLCTTSEKTGTSDFKTFSSGGGFCTASGKKVCVSDDAMTKAKSLLNESALVTDTNKNLKQKEDSGTPQSVKGVALSFAAQNKVKTTNTKLLVSCVPQRKGGFLAASGKPVAFSYEALQKAKALFSDMDLSAEIPTVSGTRKSDKHEEAQNSAGKISCGFSTAGGAKVSVSATNLLNAKNLFKELADEETPPSDSYSRSPRARKSDLSNIENVERSTDCTFMTANDKDMSAEESVPEVVESFPSVLTDPENEILRENALKGASEVKEGKTSTSWESKLHDTLRKETANVLGCEVQRTNCGEGPNSKRPEESSFQMFPSLHFSGCSETQQRFLAQEALDCTKALLEDESLSVTSENEPVQDYPGSNATSAEEQKGRGKRLGDNANMTGQPPLKRRLLEEFDRTVVGPRGLTLQPLKTCPDSVMKDRRAFKFQTSPHPNITQPHRNGKNYVEAKLQNTTPTQQCTSGGSRSAHSNKPAFAPPFLKNAKMETCKDAVLKVNTRTPPAFVPPFKKQRTIVQESSCKPQQQQEEDKHQHLFVTPTNRSTVLPPTKKTQSSTDLAGNTRKGDIPQVALADTKHDYLTDNHNVPVGGGSGDSAAKATREDDTFSRSQDMFQNLENVELARDMQDMRIRKKKRQTIRPLPGSLFLTKTSGVSRIPLKAAANGKLPGRYSSKQLYGYGVHQHVSDISSETAEAFRFNVHQFLKLEAFTDGGGVQLADGGWLIPSKDGTAGKEEFYKAMCDTPGVDPKLMSEEWVFNHFRWIVWKQASMERSFPEAMGGLCLTPQQVLLQLKYRYDVEIDHSRRPALRRIMEKDDTSAKSLVLCVCGVVSRGHSSIRPTRSDTKTPQGADAKVESPFAVVWLTDGWYAIKAQLDEPLTAMLHKGRLAVGGKLIVYGAQLVGSQEACSPLEAPESLMLKICANSTRPARWDTKLGFHRDPRPFLLPVSSLYSNGGPVGCVDITILRSYPIQWMERKPDAGVVFRSGRAEEKEERRYSSQNQKAMEILFAKIQTEFEKEQTGKNKPQRRRRTISRQDIANLQDGEELYEAVEDDPAYLEAHLSEQQMETVQTYRRSLMEKEQAELQDRYRRALEAESGDGTCPKRDVTPVWKLCVLDSMGRGSVYQLNFWRPSSDLQALLKEGRRYKVYNLSTSEGKKRSGIETVQLTGTKKTQFQDLQAQEWLSEQFQPRVSTSFLNLQNPEFQPLCGEVDLTGFIISIMDGQGSSPAFYLADGELNFVKVRCFSSFAQSGLEDVVKPRVLLALSNLQLRGQSLSPTPVVYAGDLTVFSTNPKEVHLQESLSQLRHLLQGQQNFFLTAEEKLLHLLKSDGLRSISSPAVHPLTPAGATDRRQDTKKSLIAQQPIRSVGSFTPVSGNLSAPTSLTEKDPKSLKRRRALDYLCRIPSPPALSHLGSVVTPCVKKTFNPPRRSETPSTLKTEQTPARKPVVSPKEDEWVNDEELAMIDTQNLGVGDLM
ncbi:breast cancer type 2 susceptibility protein isoform X2 [Pleuronectes platessa]|uniref:breast cancer type 2 susceptibility protein isoform X2 n=1 Tax=Pleuronectes platessa TaxID=8262 RepID=UPI00232A6D7F|nr:breast cancer type 2 susceptibility protein isoform X2 [Pleuronectes platessa]